jgi:hypothetical protein
MRRTKAGFDAELVGALQGLHRAMGRLTGFMAGSLGCLAALGAWDRLRGPSPLLRALVVAVLVLALVSAWRWLSAWRRINHWIRAVDARLGAGSGRALLELGSFQEGAFELEVRRHGMPLGKPSKRDGR